MANRLTTKTVAHPEPVESKEGARWARGGSWPAGSWFDRLAMRVVVGAPIPKRLILSLSKGRGAAGAVWIAASEIMVRQAHHEGCGGGGAVFPKRLILSLSKDEARQARCGSWPAMSWFDKLTMRVRGRLAMRIVAYNKIKILDISPRPPLSSLPSPAHGEAGRDRHGRRRGSGGRTWGRTNLTDPMRTDPRGAEQTSAPTRRSRGVRRTVPSAAQGSGTEEIAARGDRDAHPAVPASHFASAAFPTARPSGRVRLAPRLPGRRRGRASPPGDADLIRKGPPRGGALLRTTCAKVSRRKHRHVDPAQLSNPPGANAPRRFPRWSALHGSDGRSMSPLIAGVAWGARVPSIPELTENERRRAQNSRFTVPRRCGGQDRRGHEASPVSLSSIATAPSRQRGIGPGRA